MRCLVCDTEMRLAEVARDETLDVPGYEHRTYRCPGCGDEERRLTFSRDGDVRPAEPEADPAEPPTAAAPAGEPASADPGSQRVGTAASSTDPSPAIDPHAGERPARIAPPALAQRLAKLVSTIKGLPASASRLAKPTLRRFSSKPAPRASEPVASLAARLAPELRAARPAPPPAALPAESERLPEGISAVRPPFGAPTSSRQLLPVPASDAAAATLEDFEDEWKPLLLKMRQQQIASANSVSNEPEGAAALPLDAAAELAAAGAVPAPPAAEPPAPVAPAIAPAQADLGFAEEEALLKSAMDNLRTPLRQPPRAPARDARPTPTRTPARGREPPRPAVPDREPARAAASDAAPPCDPEPTEPANPKRTASTKPVELAGAIREKRQLASRVVRIQQDPDVPRYLAMDVASGMTVMWHRDTAHLRAMCDRVGWQVVDD